MPNDASDILGNDAHLLFGEIEMLGEQVLHHVRRLRALIDGQALVARVPVGDDGARLHGDAGMAAEQEGRLHHRVGRCEGLVDLAHVELALEAEIVAELRLDHRRAGIERGFRIGDRGQLVVHDVDQLAGIFRLRAGAGDHRANRFALPAGTIDGDGVLRSGLEAFQMREHADPGSHHLGKFGAGDDRDHAGSVLRRLGFDLGDARVGMRRTHEGDMGHAWQGDVADILSAPLREPCQIRSRHRAADIGVRPIERGQHGRGVVGDFHAGFPRFLFTSP